jgi:hypothetical protein
MTNNNTDLDEFAESAFKMHDVELIDKYGLAPAEYVREVYGLDPAEYDSSADLRKAMGSAGIEQNASVGMEQNASAKASKAREHAERKGTRELSPTLPHVRKAREQLADSPDDDVSKGEQLAEGVLTGKDVRAASGHDLTAAEYLAGVYDVDPEEYAVESALRRDVSKARRESGKKDLEKEAEQLAARLAESDPSPSGEATAEQLADSPETGPARPTRKPEVDPRENAIGAMTSDQVNRLAHSDLEADDFVREQLGVDPSEYRFLALRDELHQLDGD